MKLPNLKNILKESIKEKNRICLRYAKNFEECIRMLEMREQFTCQGSCFDRHEKIKEMLKTHKNELLNRNIIVANENWLGAGCQGEAFDIGGGKVLKITPDVRETYVAHQIKEKQFKHLYNVHEVFKFENNDWNWYGIVQEKLDKLNEEKDKIVIEILKNNKFKQALIKAFYDIKDYELSDSLANNYANAYGVFFPAKKRKKSIETIKQIMKGLKELQPYGMPDISHRNTMKRKNKYVIIDFGIDKDIEELKECLSNELENV